MRLALTRDSHCTPLDGTQVWVLDSNPGRLPRDRSDVARVMAEIGHIPVPLRSRDDLLAHLQVLGFRL